MLRKLIILATLITIASCSPQPETTEFAVIGYLPHYRMDSVLPTQIQGLTHLIYFSIDPPADGIIAEPIANREHLAKLSSLRESVGCKLLLCVGGWGKSDGFPQLAADAQARNRFIETLTEFCETHEFDGVDYDWEHPKDAREMELYRQLVADTKTQFTPLNLEVTIAQASWQDLGKDIYGLVDRIHFMSYDHEYPQATYEQTKADLENLIAWGCPPEKIALGLPFYGRNEKREARTYADLIADQETGSETDIIEGYAHNGPATIQAKTQLAQDQNLAGVMIWEIAQDSREKETSLLQAILQVSKN
ncbi:MAG: glycoside hydrolase family 18 protein [Verrucomicrobiota bacterium]